MMDLKAKVGIPVSNAKTKFLDEGADRRPKGRLTMVQKIGVSASWLLVVWLAALVSPTRSFYTAHAQIGPYYEGKTVRVIIPGIPPLLFRTCPEPDR